MVEKQDTVNHINYEPQPTNSSLQQWAFVYRNIGGVVHHNLPINIAPTSLATREHANDDFKSNKTLEL